MKRIFRFAICAIVLVVTAACSRHTIIPDDELARIFRDAFLANAYIGSENVKTDSLNIYEPIFASYGYTTADVQYTIGNFSKRKSARLGDVVEQAITMLEEQGVYYNYEVAVLDTVNNVARRTLTRPVRSDSLIRVRSLRDTSRLRIAVDVVPGEYTVDFKYKVDSLDRNESGLRGVMWLEGADRVRKNVYTMSMRRGDEERFTRRFTTDTSHRKLYVNLATFAGKPAQPSITIRDLRVDYTPPTAVAVDSLYARQLDIRIFADEFIRAINPKDSL